MKNIPKKIYLQIGDDCMADDFKELSKDDITWDNMYCFHNDLEFYYFEEPLAYAKLADLNKDYNRLLEENERLKKLLKIDKPIKANNRKPYITTNE